MYWVNTSYSTCISRYIWNNELTNYYMDNPLLRSMYWLRCQMSQPFYGKSRRYNRDNHWQLMENHSYLPGWCKHDRLLNLHGCDTYIHRSYEIIVFNYNICYKEHAYVLYNLSVHSIYQDVLPFTFPSAIQWKAQKNSFFGKIICCASTIPKIITESVDSSESTSNYFRNL